MIGSVYRIDARTDAAVKGRFARLAVSVDLIFVYRVDFLDIPPCYALKTNRLRQRMQLLLADPGLRI